MVDLEERRARHWQRTRNVTIWMLVIWVFFSFVIHWFAKGLNTVTFIGFPMGFYMAAQGSLLIFVIQIFVHNHLQDKIDREEGFSGDDNPDAAQPDNS